MTLLNAFSTFNYIFTVYYLIIIALFNYIFPTTLCTQKRVFAGYSYI